VDADNKPRCKTCQSENQSTFTGEVAVHFPGLQGVEKPIVWVFPKILPYRNGAPAEFPIPEKKAVWRRSAQE
jgi:hypothetical protein